MTTNLHEAIAAARSGDPQRAQLLTAEYLETRPDDANGWYLLSQLVDSEARRAVYLNRVLALDPTHERARAEFGALPLELTEALSQASMAIPVAEVATAPTLATAESQPISDVIIAPGPPEWLQPLGAEPAPPVPVATAVASTPTPPPAVARPRPSTMPPPPPPRRQGNQALAILLALLGLLTLVVLAFLIYLLLF